MGHLLHLIFRCDGDVMESLWELNTALEHNKLALSPAQLHSLLFLCLFLPYVSQRHTLQYNGVGRERDIERVYVCIAPQQEMQVNVAFQPFCLAKHWCQAMGNGRFFYYSCCFWDGIQFWQDAKLSSCVLCLWWWILFFTRVLCFQCVCLQSRSAIQ